MRGLAALFSLFLLAWPGLSLAQEAQHLREQPLAIVRGRAVLAKFSVQVADSEDTRETGLMYRKALGQHEGMIFLFSPPQSVTFWMKNTYIPLDILFVGPDGRIITIARRATPLSEAMVPSNGTVASVLEIAGGRAAQLHISEGDQVELQPSRH